MRTWTYGEVRTKVERDLDLQDETFVADEEMIDYANEAIDEAEAEILKIHEDYFLTKTTLSLVNGTETVALPSDIYASKIRALIYKNGNTIYTIQRVRTDQKFQDFEETQYNGQGMTYRYMLEMASATSQAKIYLAPIPAESGAYLRLYYIRNAFKIPQIGDTSYATLALVDAVSLDIPEFTNFVIQYMKCRCLEKEGDPRLDAAVAVLQQQRKMMVDTLTQRVPDDDDTIVPDMSHYWDHT